MKRSTCLNHDLPSESLTVVAWESGAVAARSEDISIPDIIIPHSSGFWGGSGELSYCSREGV